MFGISDLRWDLGFQTGFQAPMSRISPCCGPLGIATYLIIVDSVKSNKSHETNFRATVCVAGSHVAIQLSCNYARSSLASSYC